jgi:hypothetical protein
MLTKQDAVKIATKLNAEYSSRKNSVHDIALIHHKGKLVAHFGIVRGSNRDSGHNHISKALSVGPHFCKELSICTKTREDWIKELEQKALLL